MITIRHSEISSVAAGRLGKGYTAEGVAKTVTEYAQACFDLMREKGPNDVKEKTLVETPLAGFEISYHESRVKKNPDGTETKTGPRRTAKVALPNAMLQGINADLIESAVKLGAGIVKAVLDAKKSA